MNKIQWACFNDWQAAQTQPLNAWIFITQSEFLYLHIFCWWIIEMIESTTDCWISWINTIQHAHVELFVMPLCLCVMLCRVYARCKAERSLSIPGWSEQWVCHGTRAAGNSGRMPFWCLSCQTMPEATVLCGFVEETRVQVRQERTSQNLYTWLGF